MSSILNKVYYHTAPYKVEETFQLLSAPEDEFVMVQYLFCGICGGDYSVYCGRRTEYPASLGHEFVARIVELGKNCVEYSIGEYVISDFNYRCNNCKYCKSGKSHLCVHNNIQKFSNRGFANYATIHKNYLYKIPTFRFLPKACLIEPLSCVIHACEKLSLDAETTIVINGCGSIGMLFIFYLTRILNCTNIQVVEKNEMRRNKILRHFFVTNYNNTCQTSADLVIECSNSIDGMNQALDICDIGGSLCIMSHLYGLDTSFIYETICKKELQAFCPLRNGERKNIELAIHYIDCYWSDSYNDMLGIFNHIEDGFAQKNLTEYNKQIIRFEEYPHS